MMDVFPRVRQMMVEILQVPQDLITPQTLQEHIENWDSLEHLNLMLALEEEFDLSLGVEELSSLTSVAAILDFLGSHSHEL